jgi:hypothetical protein
VEEGEVGWWVGRTEAGRAEGGGEREEKKGKATLRYATRTNSRPREARPKGEASQCPCVV